MHHADCSFTYFGGILRGRFLAHHGSIFSRKGASSKPGAIHANNGAFIFPFFWGGENLE
jgi:hypothetical protein